jgi:glycerol-3-phosphate dehydrogenase
MHPIDGRPVFAFPWEGVTLVGTTDVDCDVPLDEEPSISPEEVAYLMAAVTDRFPALNLGLDDVIGSFSGIRPVIGSGKADPSEESREHVVWEENGLLTVTGGKLTTFWQTARDALQACTHLLEIQEGAPETKLDDDLPILDPVSVDLSAVTELDDPARQRLIGRYGADVPDLVGVARPEELASVAGTNVLWAEIRWAARSEGVVHLDDLMLRRVRLGLLLADGGNEVLGRIGDIVREELGWDNARLAAEIARYRELRRSTYGVPRAASVPDWRPMLAQATAQRENKALERTKVVTARRRWAGAALLMALVVFLIYLLSSRNRGDKRV